VDVGQTVIQPFTLDNGGTGTLGVRGTGFAPSNELAGAAGFRVTSTTCNPSTQDEVAGNVTLLGGFGRRLSCNLSTTFHPVDGGRRVVRFEVRRADPAASGGGLYLTGVGRQVVSSRTSPLCFRLPPSPPPLSARRCPIAPGAPPESTIVLSLENRGRRAAQVTHIDVRTGRTRLDPLARSYWWALGSVRLDADTMPSAMPLTIPPGGALSTEITACRSDADRAFLVVQDTVDGAPDPADDLALELIPADRGCP
jgi:hypothetical protein